MAVCASAPNAGSEHFVIVNNNDAYPVGMQGNDYATVLRLEGTRQNPLLMQTALLNSGEPSILQGSYTPTVQIVRIGSGTCVFMADSAGPQATTPNEITSFKYPSMKPVGNFSDSNASSSELGILIAARGNYLFAAYDGYQTESYLATWEINPDCTLTLLGTYPVPYLQMTDLATTPNGQTLVLSEFDSEFCCVDSFSVGAGGVLNEHGPYGIVNAEGGGGIDITADGAFAILAAEPICNPKCYNQINVFAINTDGSLGTQYVFGGDGSLGPDSGGGWPWLSPNAKFLFETGEGLTTLNFSETPLNVTYSGCHTKLKIPVGADSLFPTSLATTATSGSGEGLYVADLGLAETYYVPAVAILAINPSSGCTTEISKSPFLIPDPNSYLTSLVAWPPRPF